MRTYEAVFIFRPEDQLLAEGKEFLKKLFETTGCKILKEEDMGNRELAYEIKKQKRGHYIYYEVDSEPQSIQDFNKSLKLRSEILKYIFFRKEE